jgi:hypothetical protein
MVPAHRTARTAKRRLALGRVWRKRQAPTAGIRKRCMTPPCAPSAAADREGLQAPVPPAQNRLRRRGRLALGRCEGKGGPLWRLGAATVSRGVSAARFEPDRPDTQKKRPIESGALLRRGRACALTCHGGSLFQIQISKAERSRNRQISEVLLKVGAGVPDQKTSALARRPLRGVDSPLSQPPSLAPRGRYHPGSYCREGWI